MLARISALLLCAICARAAAQLPASAAPFMALNGALESNDPDAALAVLSREFSANPANSELATLIGQLALLQHDTASAQQHFKLAARAKQADASVELLQRLAEDSAPPAAEPEPLPPWLLRNPDHALAWFALGSLRARQGNWPGAHEAFMRAHAIAPADPFILANAAISLDQLGQSAAAAGLYRRSLRLAQGEPFFEAARFEQRLAALETRSAQR